MLLSILQLNINSDNFWDNLTEFLTRHDFDILQLQEITGKDTISGNVNSKRDCFEELKQILEGTYKSELAISGGFTSSPAAYIGNATFYKKDFSLVEKHVLSLYHRDTPFPSDATSYEMEGRTLLHLKLNIHGKNISFLNTHLAWAKTPKEEPHQTEQSAILINYLKTVPDPFILSGDFNLDPQQPTVKTLNELAHNLIAEHEIDNTLNPRTHRAKTLFPRGVAVDYIFASQDLEIKKFNIIEEDFSDHFGLTVEIKL